MRKTVFLSILALLVSSCGGVTPIPTSTIPPTQNAEKINTPNTTEITITHPELEVITPENVDRIELIERWGKGMVYGVEISPDGSQVGVGTSTGVYLYSSITAEEIGYINLPIAPEEKYGQCNMQEKNIAFSPDGRYLAIADKSINVWDLTTDSLNKNIIVEVTDPDFIISEVEFSPDGNKIITYQKDKHAGQCYFGWRSFVIYDLGGGKEIFRHNFIGSDENPSTFQFGSENSVYFYVDPFQESGLKIFKYDISSGYVSQKEIPDVFASKTFAKSVMSYSEFASDSSERVTHLFDLDSGASIRTISDLAVVIPDSELVLIGDGNFNLEITDGKRICSFNNPDRVYPHLLQSLTSDEKLGISWDYNKGEIRLWDFDNCEISSPILYFHESARKLKFSPDGKSLLTGSSGGYGYFVLDVETGNFRYTVQADNLYDVYDVDFSAGGKNIAVLSKNAVKEYDALTGTFLRDLFDLEQGALGGFITFSSDGSKVLYSQHASSAPLNLRNIFNEAQAVKSLDVGKNSVLSEDGNYLVGVTSIVGGTEIRFVNADNGQVILNKNGKIPGVNPWDIVFNNSLSRFAYMDNDYFVYLWTVPEFQLEEILYLDRRNAIFQGMNKQIFFSPDGRLLIGTGYNPSEVLFWGVDSENFLHRIPVTETRYYYGYGFLIDVSPDGRLLATLESDGTVHIWGIKKK